MEIDVTTPKLHGQLHLYNFITRVTTELLSHEVELSSHPVKLNSAATLISILEIPNVRGCPNIRTSGPATKPTPTGAASGANKLIRCNVGLNDAIVV
jgi:hypothetical protein